MNTLSSCGQFAVLNYTYFDKTKCAIVTYPLEFYEEKGKGILLRTSGYVQRV
jgi:hypothetical protein